MMVKFVVCIFFSYSSSDDDVISNTPSPKCPPDKVNQKTNNLKSLKDSNTNQLNCVVKCIWIKETIWDGKEVPAAYVIFRPKRDFKSPTILTPTIQHIYATGTKLLVIKKTDVVLF